MGRGTLSLRSKRFRLVSEQKKTDFAAVFDSCSSFFALNRTETFATKARGHCTCTKYGLVSGPTEIQLLLQQLRVI